MLIGKRVLKEHMKIHEKNQCEICKKMVPRNSKAYHKRKCSNGEIEKLNCEHCPYEFKIEKTVINVEFNKIFF